MHVFDFIAVVFATVAIIEVWHKGSIFTESRARVQALQDVTDPRTLKGRVLELVMCPFCASYHIPFYLLLLLSLSGLAGNPISVIVRLLVYSLAATKISNTVAELTTTTSKTNP